LIKAADDQPSLTHTLRVRFIEKPENPRHLIIGRVRSRFALLRAQASA
jgi:hypothetical protein